MVRRVHLASSGVSLHLAGDSCALCRMSRSRSRSAKPRSRSRSGGKRSRTRSRSRGGGGRGGGGKGGGRSRSRSRSRGRGGGGGGGGGGSGKRRLKGEACRWNMRGFGFIKPEDGGEDLFCHVSSIKVAFVLRWHLPAMGAELEFVDGVCECEREKRATEKCHVCMRAFERACVRACLRACVLEWSACMRACVFLCVQMFVLAGLVEETSTAQ